MSNLKSTLRRQLPSRRSRRVLFAPDFYIPGMHEGIVEYAKRASWVLNSRVTLSHELPENWCADGILTFIDYTDEFGPRLRASRLPMVNMSPLRTDSVPTVHLDHEAAGRLAAEHLLGRCIQNMASIQMTPSSLTSQSRRRGFEQCVRNSGRPFEAFVTRSTDDGSPAVLAALAMFLKRLAKPVGILTETDHWAAELVHLCQEIGLIIPDEVAVVGVGNESLVVNVSPISLTSVDINLFGCGYEAAALLDRLLDGGPPPSKPLLIPPIAVVQRESTNLIASRHNEVAAALQYIDAHFREPISVADVAMAVSVSRRHLHNLFLRHVGLTVAQEITRNRLSAAKQLLHTTEAKLSVISRLCGFGSQARMANVFTRVLRTTPGAFRHSSHVIPTKH